MARNYSNSRIETFDTCPRQYKFQYIEKAVVEKPVSVETFLGSAAHRALEKLYILKMNGRVPALEEVMAFYLEYWEGPDKDRIKVTRESLGVDDYIKVGAESLKKYYEQYYPFDEGDIIALEKNITFPLDPSGRFGISAKIDRVSRRSDGVVEIIDYKTKTFLPAQQSLDDDNQMGLYQMGVNYIWPDFKEIELKLIFLRQGTSMSTVMGGDKIEEIRYRIYQKILEIEKAGREDDFPPRESAICDWCVYYGLCPAKRHKLALEEKIEFVFDAKMGKELAQKYLELNDQKKKLESELKALKDDILKYSEEADVTNIAADAGSISISVREAETFPTKSDSEDDYLVLSQHAREAALDECFKLDPNILYKEYFARERLPRDLAEKLRKYLIKKRQATLRTYYKGQ